MGGWGDSMGVRCVALSCVVYCSVDQKERLGDDERVRIRGKMNETPAFTLISHIFARSTLSYVDSTW